MGLAVYYGVPILIISSSTTVLIGVSFGFRPCGIYTFFLVLNFCYVYFSISLSTLAPRSLYSEALFNGCSCAARLLSIYCCCDANASISCRISLEASFFIPTDPVLWYLMLAASLVKKSLKLLQLLALVGLSRQLSRGRLKNSVSSMTSYAEKMVFFSFNGSSLASENIFQSSMWVNIDAMGVVGSQCASNAILFSCSCLGRTVP